MKTFFFSLVGIEISLDIHIFVKHGESCLWFAYPSLHIKYVPQFVFIVVQLPISISHTDMGE